MHQEYPMSTPRISFIRSSLLTFATACAVAPAAWAGGSPDVGVSVSVSQPGFYGQVNIGNAPPPLIYAQPVVIVQPRQPVRQAPLYLRVPPGHEKHWSKHCGEYRACGRPVYFVRYDEHDRDRYNQEYERGRGHDHDEGRGYDEHDHGHGHGKAHGRHGRD
jgi:hypothetical protein